MIFTSAQIGITKLCLTGFYTMTITLNVNKVGYRFVPRILLYDPKKGTLNVFILSGFFAYWIFFLMRLLPDQKKTVFFHNHGKRTKLLSVKYLSHFTLSCFVIFEHELHNQIISDEAGTSWSLVYSSTVLHGVIKLRSCLRTKEILL